jgi:hypothetical protein
MFKQKKQHEHRSIVQKTFGGIFVLLVIGFIAYNLYPLIHGPAIAVNDLTNGQVLHQSVLSLVGTAKFTRDLRINGTPVTFNVQGDFAEDLVLAPGYNTVTISGTDKYGTVRSHSYAIVLDEPSVPFAMADQDQETNLLIP